MRDALAEIADAAAVLEGTHPRAARLLAAVLAGERVEEVLGVEHGPGRRSLATRIAHARRDEALRQAAARFFPGESTTRQAAELATRWSRYEAGPWLREKALTACPPARVGTLGETFWRLGKDGHLALSPARLRAVLANYAYSQAGS